MAGSTRLEQRAAKAAAPQRGAPVASSLEEVPTPRRWGLVAGGAMLIVACGLGVVALWRTAGNREPVVVAARDVARGEVIEREDLRTALVAAEPGVATIPESDLDELVGRLALTGWIEGSLLSPGDIAGDDDRVVADGEALVGARLGPGAVPLAELPAGTEVMVVIRPGPSDRVPEVREVRGWLAELGDRDPNSGAREASLVVPEDAASEVAAAAAEERIAVVGLEG